MFGISFGQLSSFSKLTYAAIFAAVVIGFLYYGFTKLDDSKPEKKNSKRRKSPKKNE